MTAKIFVCERKKYVVLFISVFAFFPDSICFILFNPEKVSMGIASYIKLLFLYVLETGVYHSYNGFDVYRLLCGTDDRDSEVAAD